MHRPSKHAELRAAQRNVDAETINLVCAWHDLERPAGDKCRWVALSHQACRKLIEGGRSSADVAKASSISLLLSEDGTVVTVLRWQQQRRTPVRGRARANRNGRRRFGPTWRRI